jgi:hypothetical protein
MELFSKIKKAVAAIAAKITGEKEAPVVAVKKLPIKKKAAKPKSKKA